MAKAEIKATAERAAEMAEMVATAETAETTVATAETAEMAENTELYHSPLTFHSNRQNKNPKNPATQHHLIQAETAGMAEMAVATAEIAETMAAPLTQKEKQNKKAETDNNPLRQRNQLQHLQNLKNQTLKRTR